MFTLRPEKVAYGVGFSAPSAQMPDHFHKVTVIFVSCWMIFPRPTMTENADGVPVSKANIT